MENTEEFNQHTPPSWDSRQRAAERKKKSRRRWVIHWLRIIRIYILSGILLGLLLEFLAFKFGCRLWPLLSSKLEYGMIPVGITIVGKHFWPSDSKGEDKIPIKRPPGMEVLAHIKILAKHLITDCILQNTILIVYFRPGPFSQQRARFMRWLCRKSELKPVLFDKFRDGKEAGPRCQEGRKKPRLDRCSSTTPSRPAFTLTRSRRNCLKRPLAAAATSGTRCSPTSRDSTRRPASSSFSVLALQNGVDIKTLSAMLGHYSAGFTLDTYAHVTTSMQTKAANTVSSFLSGAVR